MSGKILSLLGSASCKEENSSNRTCIVGKFSVRILRSGDAFEFWEAGRKKGAHVWVFNGGRSLLVVDGRERTLLSDLYGLKIVKHFGGYRIFPHVELEWSGRDEPGKTEKGALVLVSVDFNSSCHAVYGEKYPACGFTIFGAPREGESGSCKSPETLEDVEEITKKKIEKNINFDAEAKKIIDDSKLKELLEELQLLAGKNPELERE